MGRRFYLRSPQASVLEGFERAVAGLAGAVLEVWKGTDPCHHERCDRPGVCRSRPSAGFSGSPSS